MSRAGRDASESRPPRGVTPAPKTLRMRPRTPTSAAVRTRSPDSDVQLEVVHAHDLHAVDVHDLLVEQVAREEDLVLPRGTVQEVLPHEPRPHGAALENGDVLPGQDERLEAVADEEARDARKRGARARGDGEVRDLPDRVPRHVPHRLAEELRDEEALVRGHGRGARRRGRRGCHGGIVRRPAPSVNVRSADSRRNLPPCFRTPSAWARAFKASFWPRIRDSSSP